LRDTWIIFSSLFVLILLYHPHVSCAKIEEMKVEKEGPVDIEADQLIYEQDQQVYHAHGQVEIVRGNLSLKADHANLSTVTKELKAWGNVILREGEDVLECERMEINLDTRLGKIHQARLFLRDQNFHVIGREAEKLGENVYRVRDGSFTTCDAERPPWKFTAKELEITLGGYGVATGPIFYIEDIPVLYLPIGVFPVIHERQTGFLLPRVGYSSKYGPALKTAFFWAMAKDMDATFYFDWVEERGFKEGLEYRYAFAQDTKGEAKFYFTDDQVFSGQRYAFFLQHQQKLPYDLYLKWNINHVSDNEYVRDFDEDLPEGTKIDSRSTRVMRSNLFGGKNWDQYSFIMNGEVFNDLTIESNDETIQKLPQISFHAHPQSLFETPVFYSFDSSYNNFWVERGVRAHRWDSLPRISYPMRLFNVFKLDPSFGFRETLYRPYHDRADRFDPWESRENYEAGMEASTELYRVYDREEVPKISSLFKVNKWMHTLEPKIGYLYMSGVHQKGISERRENEESIPIFDEVDQIPYTNEITYGITQRLIGKPEKEGVTSGPFEYAKLDISQSYSLGDPFERDSEGRGRYFSNIRAELWWHFSPYVGARWKAEFDPYHRNFDVFNFLINMKDRRNDGLRVHYRYTQDNIQDNIREINLDARIRTIPPLYLFGSVRYNLVDHWKVENIYGVEYTGQCWTLGVFVEDRGESPDGTQEKEVKGEVYFTLLNLGAMGHRPHPMQ
jgi:LPS-assembly protein